MSSIGQAANGTWAALASGLGAPAGALWLGWQAAVWPALFPVASAAAGIALVGCGVVWTRLAVGLCTAYVTLVASPIDGQPVPRLPAWCLPLVRDGRQREATLCLSMHAQGGKSEHLLAVSLLCHERLWPNSGGLADAETSRSALGAARRARWAAAAGLQARHPPRWRSICVVEGATAL